MAGGHVALTARSRLRPAAAWAGLALGVLVLHLLALETLARWRPASASALQAMADPLFTRVLAPAPPPPLPAPDAPASASPAAAPSEGALQVSAATAEPPARRTPELAAPRPAASAAAPAPESAPPPVAMPTEPAQEASAPTDVASAAPQPQPQPQPAAPAPATATATAAPVPAAAPGAPPTPAFTWPPDTRITYRLEGQFRGNPLYGSARVQWQRQGGLYQARVDIGFGLLGTLSLTSQGELGPHGLVPRTYEELRGSRRRSVRLTDREVVLHDGRSLPRPDQVQDAASQFVELGQRFASGRQPLVLGGTVDVWLARPGGLDRWTYDVAAQELLSTPRLGEVAAWRLTPRPIATPRGQITAEFWFAPALQYLPARIRLTLGQESQIDLVVDVIEQR